MAHHSGARLVYRRGDLRSRGIGENQRLHEPVCPAASRGWQAANPQMRAAALVLEVKGDFCYDIRQILAEAGREKDYIELGMEGRWQWNPLSAWWLDSYSLAYTVSSLLNQLFGKGKEPFWQQAYTNLVRWIIELHRVFPERWVTLQQVYRCAIDPELFAAKIEEAEKLSDDLNKGTVFVPMDVWNAQLINLAEWVWKPRRTWTNSKPPTPVR